MNDAFHRFIDHWITQDVLVIGGFALVFFLLRAGAKNENWQRAWVRLKRDRTGLISLGVVCLYLFIGALETMQLPTADGGSHSILDLFVEHIPREKTYSAPFADSILASAKHEKLLSRHVL